MTVSARTSDFPSFAEVRSFATRSRANVIPVSIEFSADLLTPVSAYLRVTQGGKRAFLLESVEGGEQIARYSFIGVDPFETLVVRRGALWIGEQKLTGDPMKGIREYLRRYKSAHSPGLPPFTGGAVGYVGYECSQFLEPKIRVRASSALDAHLMVFRGVIAFDHVKHSVILINNILTDRESLRAGYDRAKPELLRLKRMLATQVSAESPLKFDSKAEAPLTSFKPALGARGFFSAVSRIRSHIRAGDIFQCVLSDQFKFKLQGSPFAVYRALRTLSPAPYLFFLSMGEETLLGASPEMLTRVSEGRVETCPIAGTRPRGADDLEDKKFERHLLASVKEKAEHLMLVDLGRNDLGRVSKAGTVSVREFMKVERFSHVMHLVSNVEGRLKPGLSGWDALMSCFPAGTLSGAPKIRAQQIISELEPVARGPYGGAVVYADFSGRLDSCIAIRSLSVRAGVGTIQAGAGVVADSRASNEYREVVSKTRALRRAIAAVGAIKRGKR